ncbi:hypothetical protein M758_9G102800 [Ceratodon purpureus]|nr:hypothetical protein M758_9G102800 [Ceratodon purpureus]
MFIARKLAAESFLFLLVSSWPKHCPKFEQIAPSRVSVLRWRGRLSRLEHVGKCFLSVNSCYDCRPEQFQLQISVKFPLSALAAK